MSALRATIFFSPSAGFLPGISTIIPVMANSLMVYLLIPIDVRKSMILVLVWNYLKPPSGF